MLEDDNNYNNDYGLIDNTRFSDEEWEQILSNKLYLVESPTCMTLQTADYVQVGFSDDVFQTLINSHNTLIDILNGENEDEDYIIDIE